MKGVDRLLWETHPARLGWKDDGLGTEHNTTGGDFFPGFINYILEALCHCQLLLPSAGLSRTPSGAHPPAGEAVIEKHRIPSRRVRWAGPPSLSFPHLLAGRPSFGTGNSHKNSTIDRSRNAEQLFILCLECARWQLRWALCKLEICSIPRALVHQGNSTDRHLRNTKRISTLNARMVSPMLCSH